MKITKRQLRRIIKEEMQTGIDMLNWNQLQVGDLVDVDGEWNYYSKVRITEKLDDVSQHSGLEPGPGFAGTDEFGDEIVFPVSEVIPSSYAKYAMAENRKIKKIVKEEKAKLLSEQSREMYLEDDELRELGEYIGDLIHYSSEVESIMGEMSRRYGELAHLTTSSREIKNAIAEMADKFDLALENMERFR